MELVPKPVSGLIDKIEKNADKLGMVVGGYSQFGMFGKTESLDPISGAVKIFTSILSDPHLPNLSHVAGHLMNEQISPFKPAVVLAIAGWILREVDMLPMATKAGNILLKAGGGAAATSALISMFMHSGYWHSPGNGGGIQTASMYPQMSFNVGGPNAPHASNASGYKNLLSTESVVA